jgi:wyosine [tRNA(Phe)-imidazoG37] synthetase (radical SAM superfamily)
MIISLNAARKESYEALMPPLKWDRILRNIERIQEEKARQGRDRPQLQAGYVLNKHNLDELPELPSLLRRIGVEACRIIELKVPKPIQSRALLTDEDVASHDRTLALRKFEEFEAECRAHDIRLTQPLPAF